MATATGADFKLYSKEEATEGTLPGSTGWDQLPCYSFNLAGSQTLAADPVLSANATRDGGTPFLDGVQIVAGEAVVPIESVHFPKWLKLAYGAPTTTGAGPNYQHVFKSGSAALVTRAFEKAFPNISKFYRNLGVRVNTISIDIGPDGLPQATLGLMGLTESDAQATSAAGTATITAYKRFLRAKGLVKRNGSDVAGVTGGAINFSNGMEAARALRADNRVEAIDPGLSTGGGNLTLRFNDDAIGTAAAAFTASSIEYSLAIDANTSIAFLYAQSFFNPNGPVVTGPGVVSRDFTFVAGNDGTAGVSLLQVTVKNQVASY